MKLKMETTKLQGMLSKSIKGVGNNKLIPLTSLMLVKLEDNTLTLVTTDATNYLYIREPDIKGEDFYVTLYAEQFSKLIARLTSEYVSLELKQSAVEVISGNGVYLLELPLDENGELIKYPDPLNDFVPSDDTVELDYETVKTVLTEVKSALAVTLEEPCYTNYYVGDAVIATDRYKIAYMDKQVFDKARLISADTFELLSVTQAEKISVDFNDPVIVFDTPQCTIYGNTSSGVEDFSADIITGLVQEEFDCMCKLSKTELLQALDRLMLFVGQYDKNSITLTFDKKALQVSSKAATGIETIEYLESVNHKNFTGCVDIKMFTTQVNVQCGDTVKLYYGADNSIKIVDDDSGVQHITALLDDDDGGQE